MIIDRYRERSSPPSQQPPVVAQPPVKLPFATKSKPPAASQSDSQSPDSHWSPTSKWDTKFTSFNRPNDRYDRKTKPSSSKSWRNDTILNNLRPQRGSLKVSVTQKYSRKQKQAALKYARAFYKQLDENLKTNSYW